MYGRYRGYYTVTSSYCDDRSDSFNNGIDIAGSGILGADVLAADAGTVTASFSGCTHNWGKADDCGCGGGYGNYVIIDHGNGKETLYAHLTSAEVTAGDQVEAGQLIGYAGTTGHSTGPHLHFECRYNGATYDPMSEY